jgi:hypothetical protein
MSPIRCEKRSFDKYQLALHRIASHRIVLSGQTQFDFVAHQRQAPVSLVTL